MFAAAWIGGQGRKKMELCWATGALLAGGWRRRRELLPCCWCSAREEGRGAGEGAAVRGAEGGKGGAMDLGEELGWREERGCYAAREGMDGEAIAFPTLWLDK